MAELACFDCFTTYNSLVGHYCFNGWWIPGVANGNATAQAVEKELDSLKQESTQGPCVQVNATASEGTELVTTNPEFYDENYLSNQMTYGNDQTTYSSQDYTTGGTTNQLMAMNSEQNHVEQCAISDLNNPTLFCRMELGTNDCNMAMRFNFPNSEMASNMDRLTSMVCQLGLDEDNLNIPSIPNSSNNTPDFATVSGSINNLKMYEFQTQDAFEDIQTRTKIQNNHSKFISNLVEGNEASEMSNESRIINEERGRIKHQLFMKNEFTTEMTVDNIQLTEMYQQFSRHGPNTHRSLVKGALDNLTNNSAVIESDPSRHLMLRNIYKVHNKHESSLQTGSINSEVSRIRTNAELMRHKCTNASTEYKIGLNDTNFRRALEESALIGISCTEKSHSVEDCHVDAAHASAGPSFSQLNERNISVSLKKFQSHGNVKQHCVVNTSVKLFICNVCQKLFKQKSHLKTHLFIHEEIKPYRCSICGKSFTQNIHLQRHGLVHTGEKPFTCELCSKGFKQKQDLKRHMPIHTGEKLYLCEVCGKAFTRKDSLNQHALIHKDDKTFECEVCGKSFRRKEHLKRHALTHTGDKPFECKLCGRMFLAKSSLNRHKKTHKPK
ncbi:Zinc finger protein 234 [Araneus ventricosus]|uniref:Zinc finger protein 234 n=1 Tax=Araneus ventricosus TaxID=182803 RepID=A0A4Y2S775_ARAVE|nr:Zinc finger protein 234 [Araneus ventricosus]